MCFSDFLDVTLYKIRKLIPHKKFLAADEFIF